MSTWLSHRLSQRCRALAAVAAPLLIACARPPVTPPNNSLPQPETEARVNGITIIEAGTFTVERTSETKHAPSTMRGSVDVVQPKGDPRLVREGPTVAIAPNRSFGVRFLLQGTPLMQVENVRVRVTHPPVTDPRAGTTATIEEWDNPANIGVVRYTGWNCHFRWECVPGTWTIELLYRGAVMAKREFELQ